VYRNRCNSIVHRLCDDGVGDSGFIYGTENLGLVGELEESYRAWRLSFITFAEPSNAKESRNKTREYLGLYSISILAVIFWEFLIVTRLSWVKAHLGGVLIKGLL
jgi:hypothetical protein